MDASFLLNKYTAWYYSIINNRLLTFAEGYTERHHILPKSLGGSNDQSNLVALTAREHFICHQLLVKMTTGADRIKMIRAFNAFKMSSRKNPRKLTARQYQTARNTRAPGWNKGLTIADYTPEQQAAARKSGITKRGRKQTTEANAKRSATLAGRVVSDAHRANLSKSLKGRPSPTKGMTFEYRPMPKLCCPTCGKEISVANIGRHIAKSH